MERIWNETIRRLKRPILWKRIAVFVIVIVAIYLSVLSFKDQKVAHNLILLAGALTGLYFINRRTTAAEQDVTVERLTRSIEQLASEKASIRLGGILGLEQIAITQEEESKKIARILISFIRTRATKDSEEVKKDFDASKVSKLETRVEFSTYRAQRLDVEAAVSALTRIASELDKQGKFRSQRNETKRDLCDLQDTDLRGLRFVEADLSCFDFAGTDLSGAWLAETNLTGTRLHKFNLQGEPVGAKFTKAFLDGANFRGVDLESIDLSYTQLVGAKFNDACLLDTVLNGANIGNAYFGNNLDLTQEQIDKTYYWEGVPPPDLSDELGPPQKRSFSDITKGWKPGM